MKNTKLDVAREKAQRRDKKYRLGRMCSQLSCKRAPKKKSKGKTAGRNCWAKLPVMMPHLLLKTLVDGGLIQLLRLTSNLSMCLRVYTV